MSATCQIYTSRVFNFKDQNQPIEEFDKSRSGAINDSNVMPQLIVRDIEEKVVRRLKERAGKHGVSMEEEHRRVLREALFPRPKRRASFKEFLLSMPNVARDSDFDRPSDMGREVAL